MAIREDAELRPCLDRHSTIRRPLDLDRHIGADLGMLPAQLRHVRLRRANAGCELSLRLRSGLEIFREGHHAPSYA